MRVELWETMSLRPWGDLGDRSDFELFLRHKTTALQSPTSDKENKAAHTLQQGS